MFKLEKEMCVMRDGIRLATSVFLPEREGKFSVILMRTPYTRQWYETDHPLYMLFPKIVEHGYAVAIQDVRGSGESEGLINQNGINEYEDGYDAVEWIAEQPWCNGKVGMFGLSFFGYTQLAAAYMNPPHLVAICPFQTSCQEPFGCDRNQSINLAHLGWDYWQLEDHADCYFKDEKVREEKLAVLREIRKKLNEYNMTLPMTENPAALVKDVPLIPDYLEHITSIENKEYWDRMNIPMNCNRMHVPMFQMTGWFDLALNSTIRNYLAERYSENAIVRDEAKLIIGPWTHDDVLQTVEGITFTETTADENREMIIDMIIRWYDHWFRGEDTTCFPERVRYFETGSNEWKTASDWPPVENTAVEFPLSADGKVLNETAPDGTLPMEYDPANPAPSAFPDSNGRFFLADWSEMEGKRSDIIVFKSEPLEKDVTIAGQLILKLVASTDVPDTDFACRVFDVNPDGTMSKLGDGFVRARHRNGLFTEDFLEPGEKYEFTLDLGYRAHLLKKGHRIGVHIAGSSYPDHNRNLNTKEAPTLGKDFVVAHDVLYFGENGTRLVLPVME